MTSHVLACGGGGMTSDARWRSGQPGASAWRVTPGAEERVVPRLL